MSDSPPFIDSESGELDTSQIRAEAFPLAGLIVLFGGLALIPFLLGLIFSNSGLSILFVLATQLILAVGAGIVLMYVVARAIQLAG